jgi:protein TonB
MFGTLIESRASRQRRAGSSVASIVAHVAIIGSAVAATARQPEQPPKPVQVAILQFPTTALAEPPKTSMPADVFTSTTAIAAPRALVLDTPLLVPTDIPPIDVNGPATPTDFGNKRVVGANYLCDRDCPRVGAALDSVGRDSWTANDVMMRLREAPVPPRYPETLRRAGIEGEVVVKFVVDTTGRVDMTSLEVVRATHDAFVLAVRESIAKLRFNPSMVGDRKVPALAMMPFHFTLK